MWSIPTSKTGKFIQQRENFPSKRQVSICSTWKKRHFSFVFNLIDHCSCHLCYAFLRLLLIFTHDPCLNMYMYLRNFFKDPFFFQYYAVIKYGRRWWNPIKPGVLYGRFEQPESIFDHLVIWKELLLLTYVLYNGNRMIVISEMYWTVRYKFDSLITDKGTGKCKYFCIPYALFECSSELNIIRHALYVKP